MQEIFALISNIGGFMTLEEECTLIVLLSIIESNFFSMQCILTSIVCSILLHGPHQAV